MHLYFKNKRLAMWSEQPIEASELEHIEMNVTAQELEKIRSNAETLLKKNGKLEQIDRPPLQEKQKEDRKNIVETVKQQIRESRMDTDLKNILNQILTTIE